MGVKFNLRHDDPLSTEVEAKSDLSGRQIVEVVFDNCYSLISLLSF